jgi:hypothetical protein
LILDFGLISQINLKVCTINIKEISVIILFAVRRRISRPEEIGIDLLGAN